MIAQMERLLYEKPGDAPPTSSARLSTGPMLLWLAPLSIDDRVSLGETSNLAKRKEVPLSRAPNREAPLKLSKIYPKGKNFV